MSQATFDAIPLYIRSGVTYHHAILQPSNVGYGIHAGIFLALPRNWAGCDSRIAQLYPIAQLWAPQYIRSPLSLSPFMIDPNMHYIPRVHFQKRPARAVYAVTIPRNQGRTFERGRKSWAYTYAPQGWSIYEPMYVYAAWTNIDCTGR